MIAPTIGRVVLYHPEPSRTVPAIITYVYSDRYVNLAYFGEFGGHGSAQSVWLTQPEDETSPAEFCEWMPYQVGQAAKVEQLLAVIDATAPVAEEPIEVPQSPPPTDTQPQITTQEVQ